MKRTIYNPIPIYEMIERKLKEAIKSRNWQKIEDLYSQILKITSD